MRKLILRFLITPVAVAITAEVIPGISWTGGIYNLALIAAVFGFVNMFVKPLIKILALPVEIATLGLFTVVINGAMLYLVSYFVPALKIEAFMFSEISYGPLYVSSFLMPAFGTAVIGSLMIGFISTTLYWLTK